MTTLAPAQEVVIHAVGRRPVGEGFEQRAPAGAPRAVGHREVRDRLAGVVAQPGESGGQAPAWLQLPALGGAAVEGEDPALARLRGVEGDLQAVAEEPAGATVVVRLGGRQQVDEGGIALDDGPHQGSETRIGEGQAVLQPGDQLALGGDDARGGGDGQTLHERRIARDVGVVDGRDIHPAGAGSKTACAGRTVPSRHAAPNRRGAVSPKDVENGALSERRCGRRGSRRCTHPGQLLARGATPAGSERHLAPPHTGYPQMR